MTIQFKMHRGVVQRQNYKKKSLSIYFDSIFGRVVFCIYSKNPARREKPQNYILSLCLMWLHILTLYFLAHILFVCQFSHRYLAHLVFMSYTQILSMKLAYNRSPPQVSIAMQNSRLCLHLEIGSDLFTPSSKLLFAWIIFFFILAKCHFVFTWYKVLLACLCQWNQYLPFQTWAIISGFRIVVHKLKVTMTLILDLNLIS